ncbi:MAG TPA: PilZ domain-containing protein [Candidatus Deferrimicrobium sp.]|nr:PilZ domain-containing protein [Candidatus Deferrimicrobium sp.]
MTAIMEPTVITTEAAEPAVDTSKFDFSLLVGRELTLFSGQYPGRPLKSKVVVARGGEIAIDRGGGAGLIDNLVNNQPVTVRVEYKGQQVTMPATLKRTGNSGCRLILGEKVMPLSRRRFPRALMCRPVKLAVMPVATFQRSKLAHLRWMQTVTVDVSAGGTLIDFSSALEYPTYLFLHLDLEEILLPALVLGQVRHSLPMDAGHFRVGVEFIVREARDKHFSIVTLKQLPAQVFEFDELKRQTFNKTVMAWMHDNERK